MVLVGRDVGAELGTAVEQIGVVANVANQAVLLRQSRFDWRIESGNSLGEAEL
jgi:hypothetical protein